MSELTLTEWSDLAQVLATLVTLAGVLVSIWLSTRALKEVKEDRRLRHKPYLAFEPGGTSLPIEFKRIGRAVGGVNRAYAEEALAHVPADSESVVIKVDKDEDGLFTPLLYGSLRNYGFGPALSTEIVWIPEEVWIGTESFAVDEHKRSEPIYSFPLNSMPTLPSHIEPNGQAELSRLPTFIIKDYEKKITSVEGRISITCKDIFGKEHQAIQEFGLFTEYKDEQPRLVASFGDLIEGEDTQTKAVSIR